MTKLTFDKNFTCNDFIFRGRQVMGAHQRRRRSEQPYAAYTGLFLNECQNLLIYLGLFRCAHAVRGAFINFQGSFLDELRGLHR